MQIRIGIIGYGNLGRGVEKSIQQNPDMTLTAIFTRRSPESISPLDSATNVFKLENIEQFKDKLDVMILCGGSASDLPEQTPTAARWFNVVDSFDTHAKINEHLTAVDYAAASSGHVAIISVGWDPGMFSINRLYSAAILPEGETYTFWGKGISQGHSDAIRRIDSVLDARQYTVPIEETVDRARNGGKLSTDSTQRHIRECFVVAEEGADLDRIKNDIVTMPNYFAGYQTIVHFISMDELKEKHSAMPHGGFVIRSGHTGCENENHHAIEYSLKLDSNPEFTAGVLVAYARAAHRLNQEGKNGCLTAFDVPPAYLLPMKREEMIRKFL
ncbi:MAG: diaminopimelate dehydrogenase [Clostridiales bacterium]|nr:diaminopimelate dehydrogenase [Clostridiales bacterium]